MKKIFAIVISLILVFSLVACTSDKGNETTTEIVSTTETSVETEIIETVVDTEAPVESTVDTNS